MCFVSEMCLHNRKDSIHRSCFQIFMFPILRLAENQVMAEPQPQQQPKGNLKNINNVKINKASYNTDSVLFYGFYGFCEFVLASLYIYYRSGGLRDQLIFLLIVNETTFFRKQYFVSSSFCSLIILLKCDFNIYVLYLIINAILKWLTQYKSTYGLYVHMYILFIYLHWVDQLLCKIPTCIFNLASSVL